MKLPSLGLMRIIDLNFITVKPCQLKNISLFCAKSLIRLVEGSFLLKLNKVFEEQITVGVILFCYIISYQRYLISYIFNTFYMTITFYFTGQFFEFKFPYENFRV